MAEFVNTALTGHRETKTYIEKDEEGKETGFTKQYKDVSYSFFANPMSGDVGKAMGPKAVKNSILSILKTNFHERLFQPEFGSNIRALLFEQMNPLTVERIKDEVKIAIANHEPRANVLNVGVTPDEENNRYKVSVLFDLGTELEAQLLETLFERA
jgi:hypothetical protein